MGISKKQRDIVRLKFGGLCAYTGKELGPDWQVDHMESKYKNSYNAHYTSATPQEVQEKMSTVNHIDNLFPALRIVNHYKRSFDLEGFRRYMKDFHVRLGKLPKKTVVDSTIRRKAYMQQVADAFGITTEKPFTGIFYFETLK